MSGPVSVNPAIVLWDLDDELFAADQRIRDWDLFELIEDLGILVLFDDIETKIKWNNNELFSA